MHRQSRVTIVLISVLVALSSAGSTAAFARHRVHKHHARAATAEPTGDPRGEQPGAGAQPGPQGLFAGAGGIFSPDYEVPGGELYHFGGQLLGGGELGNAYEDYHRHYYYYKYAYCPMGSQYVYYLRRCIGPFDLFR